MNAWLLFVCQQWHNPVVSDCKSHVEISFQFINAWSTQGLWSRAAHTHAHIGYMYMYHNLDSQIIVITFLNDDSSYTCCTHELETRQSFQFLILKFIGAHNHVLIAFLSLSHCVPAFSPMSWPMRWRSVTSCSPASSLWRCFWRCWSMGRLATSRILTISLMASSWLSGGFLST